MSYRPAQVTAWMLGHYQARVDDRKALSDISIWDLDPRYLNELERRAYKEIGLVKRDDIHQNLARTQRELKEAYTEIGAQQETIDELRKLLKRANSK